MIPTFPRDYHNHAEHKWQNSRIEQLYPTLDSYYTRKPSTYIIAGIALDGLMIVIAFVLVAWAATVDVEQPTPLDKESFVGAQRRIMGDK